MSTGDPNPAAPSGSARRTQQTRPRRAIRPCDSCRKRKTRCVIPSGAGRCTICHSRDLLCTFEERPPSRPSRNRWRLDSPQDGRPAHAPDSAGQGTQAQTGLPSILPSHGPSLRQSSEALSTTGTEQSDGAHSEENGSLGLGSSRFAELYGLTSDMEPILMRHRPYDPQTEEFCLETHRIRRVSRCDTTNEYPLTFHIAEDSKAVGYEPGYSEHDRIEQCVAPYGPNLARLFWKMVHPCYPIVYKRGFVERYSRSYREVPAPLLGAVYLISLSWWSYDPELSNKLPPNATVLRSEVIGAIGNSYHRPRLSSVEATLLLLQCKPEDALNPDHTWSWGLTGQVLSIGQALGLHLDASSWAIPSWEVALRKRLSWAIYMQDKWTALMHGRPSHIDDDNWAVEDLTGSDFVDIEDDSHTYHDDIPSTDSKIGNEGFIRLVTLTQFLSEILRGFYSVKASQLQDTVELHQKAAPLLARLNTWYHDFPPTLLLGNQRPRKLCAIGFLHLAYHGVILTLLRRIIRSTALAPLCRDIDILNETRKQASEAAVSAMSFVGLLRPDHLEAFWFFSSGFVFSLVGSFLTLLLVTSRSEAEKRYWREKLNDYLWTLRVMGKASEPIAYAVNRLEGAILRGMEHALSVNIASYPEMAPNSEVLNTRQSCSQDPHQPSLHPAEDHGFSSRADGVATTATDPTTRADDDFLTLFSGDDLSGLELGQFDWLGDL